MLRVFALVYLLCLMSCVRKNSQTCATEARTTTRTSTPAFTLPELEGTWRIDSLLQYTKDSVISVKSSFQAYHFRKSGEFSLIEKVNEQFREHVYGRVKLEGRDLFVLDSLRQPVENALYHWQILQLTDQKLKMKDFTVELVAAVEGELYLTKIANLKTDVK